MRRRTGEPRARAAHAALALAALAALAAAAPARGADDVRIEVSADRTELAQDEVVVLTVSVVSDGAATLDLREAELPFTIISRTRTSSGASFSFGGGGVRLRRSAVYTITLAPKRTGDLVIPPIAAVVDGVRHEAAPLTLTVRKAGARTGPRAPPPAGGGGGGGAWQGWERDLVLEVVLDRAEVFLGEQVTATLQLRSPVGVVVYERFQPPAYDGFWAEVVDAPQRLAFKVRSVRGVPTRVYTIRRLALFPTRAGTIELGPFELDVTVRLGSDALFAAFDEIRHARRRSAPVAVRVKPLPAGAPAGFESVNVGAWKLEASVSTDRVEAGQPLAIRLTATGEGNVRALALPSLPAVEGARAFASTSSEEVTPRGGRLGGSRTVETVVVPDREGELSVPPLAWPFFSPRKGRYEVARTPALRVTVVPGPAAPAAPPPAAEALAARLGPIRTDGFLGPPAPPPWERAPFLAAIALPPLAFAGLVLLDAARARSRAGAPARRARRAGRRAARALGAARRRLARGDAPGALDGVQRALSGWAADRLGRSAAGTTRDALGAALREAGAPEDGILALAEAQDACDAARFGGGGAEEEVIALAERALDRLEPWRRGADAGGRP